MKTRQQKIDTINDMIANKDLDYGCIVESKYGKSIFLTNKNRREVLRIKYRIVDLISKDEPMKIIGHPVMIGDVLDWIYDNEMTLFEDTGINHIIDTTIKLWIGNLRKPLEEQPDKCINFIYSLIYEQGEK